MSLVTTAWKKWLALAHVIGNFQAQAILTVFYFVIVSPLGAASRFIGDPLNMKSRRMRSNFNKWDHPKETLESARKQY